MKRFLLAIAITAASACTPHVEEDSGPYQCKIGDSIVITFDNITLSRAMREAKLVKARLKNLGLVPADIEVECQPVSR